MLATVGPQEARADETYGGDWFTAVVTAATEGGNVELALDFSGLTGVEYWVEEVSAEEGDDYTGTLGSSTSWEQVTSPGSVYFAAVDDSAVETTQSFKVHVRPIDHPTDESELEADILDNDARTFTASVAEAPEGDNVVLTVVADAGVDLEYWVEDVSAEAAAGNDSGPALSRGT